MKVISNYSIRTTEPMTYHFQKACTWIAPVKPLVVTDYTTSVTAVTVARIPVHEIYN